MYKKIAVFGSYIARVPVEKSFWEILDEGSWDELWKETEQTKLVEMRGRFEFHGKGKDLAKAVIKTNRRVPKRHIDVSAEEFLKHPEKYSYEGVWIDREIESG